MKSPTVEEIRSRLDGVTFPGFRHSLVRYGLVHEVRTEKGRVVVSLLPASAHAEVGACRRACRAASPRAGSPLTLDLAYNPLGASLPPEQSRLEACYRDELRRLFDIEFHRLLTITNMPIKRFADQLHRWGEFERYMSLLVDHFNTSAAESVMCRSLVSVGWDGRLYDCDFNQMLELQAAGRDGRALSIFEFDFERMLARRIRFGEHCLGCTAGAGSSCGGTTA